MPSISDSYEMRPTQQRMCVLGNATNPSATVRRFPSEIAHRVGCARASALASTGRRVGTCVILRWASGVCLRSAGVVLLRRRCRVLLRLLWRVLACCTTVRAVASGRWRALHCALADASPNCYTNYSSARPASGAAIV